MKHRISIYKKYTLNIFLIITKCEILDRKPIAFLQ